MFNINNNTGKILNFEIPSNGTPTGNKTISNY